MGCVSRLLSSSLVELSSLVACLHPRPGSAQPGQVGSEPRSQVHRADVMHTHGRHHSLTQEACVGPAASSGGRQPHHEFGGLGSMLYDHAPLWVLTAVVQPPV